MNKIIKKVFFKNQDAVKYFQFTQLHGWIEITKDHGDYIFSLENKNHSFYYVTCNDKQFSESKHGLIFT